METGLPRLAEHLDMVQGNEATPIRCFQRKSLELNPTGKLVYRRAHREAESLLVMRPGFSVSVKYVRAGLGAEAAGEG